MAKLKHKIIFVDWWIGMKEPDTIKFDWKSEDYGRAEFILCPIWRRGKLRKVFLYPAQQPSAEFYYEIIPKDHHWVGIFFGHFLNEEKDSLSQPDIWDSFWSKQHKCQAFRFHVPVGSKELEIRTGLEKFNMNWK